MATSNNTANMPKFSERNLYSFRTQLIGGGARPNLFECDITFPDIENVSKPGQTLNFLIKAAQLPGSTIGSIPVPFRGRTLKIAGDRTYDPWTVTIINDTDFALRNAFEQWNNALSRHDDNAGIITPSSYQRDIFVRQLSRGIPEGRTGNDGTGSKIPSTGTNIPVLKTYRLFGCFPTSIDPIPLSYDSTDSIEEFNVTFEVQYMNAYTPGTKTTESNGATSTTYNETSIFNIADTGEVSTSTNQATQTATGQSSANQ